MNHSMLTCGWTTHLKIVAVALAAAMLARQRSLRQWFEILCDLLSPASAIGRTPIIG
jgi:hypothetical protein